MLVSKFGFDTAGLYVAPIEYVPAPIPLNDRFADAAPPATVPDVTVATGVIPCLIANVTVPSFTTADDGLFAVTVALSATVAACPYVPDAFPTFPVVVFAAFTVYDVVPFAWFVAEAVTV